MIKAVIFDFDGVIADTMTEHAKAYKKVLAEEGIDIELRDVFMVEGALPEVIISRLTGRPVDDEVKRLAQKKIELFKQVQNRIKPEEEAIQIIKHLKERGLRVGIATGSVKHVFQELMGEHLELLDFYLTGNDVEKQKPDPRIYLEAAEKAGVKPEECLVVENAPLGVEAAKNAGMTCIAITTTLTEKELDQADYVVNNYRQLEEKIQELTG